MSAVGSLLFCPDCGNLLETPISSKKIKCDQCAAVITDPPPYPTITSQSSPASFPSSLRSKKSAIQTLENQDLSNEATIKQACPNAGCGNDEMKFYTLQLRSADEGATVFYRCEKCGFKYNTNN